MSFVSSSFSKLKINVKRGWTNAGVNAGFAIGNSLLNYKKRDGQLKFYSPRGYDNVLVYAAKRTMMQMSFATINDLYPKYLRKLDKQAVTNAYAKYQGAQQQIIIIDGMLADSDKFNKQGVNISYRGKPATEALLLWIQNETGQAVDLKVQTYWDKIKGLSNEAAKNSILNSDTIVRVPGNVAFFDLGAIVQAQSANNLVLTKVQGRDHSRKELVSGGDVNFTVRGKIASNYPDQYPYDDVAKFVTLMQHKGVLQVFNIMFQQFNVTQVIIKDFQLTQNEGFKNVQPYSFTCVGVEPDTTVIEIKDTIDKTNLAIESMEKKGWKQVLLDQIKESAASQAAQMVESLTSSII